MYKTGLIWVHWDLLKRSGFNPSYTNTRINWTECPAATEVFVGASIIMGSTQTVAHLESKHSTTRNFNSFNGINSLGIFKFDAQVFFKFIEGGSTKRNGEN